MSFVRVVRDACGVCSCVRCLGVRKSNNGDCGVRGCVLMSVMMALTGQVMVLVGWRMTENALRNCDVFAVLILNMMYDGVLSCARTICMSSRVACDKGLCVCVGDVISPTRRSK